jgi:hypothetical protein
MANTDAHSFTSLNAAFLTVSKFRNSHSTPFCGHLLHRILSKMKENVETVGEKYHLGPYVKNGFHGSKFRGTQLLKGTRWRSPIPDLLEKMWQIRG